MPELLIKSLNHFAKIYLELYFIHELIASKKIIDPPFLPDRQAGMAAVINQKEQWAFAQYEKK